MRRIETVFALLAVAFYVWFLRRFGLHDVMSYVRLAGWGLVLTVSLESVSRVANTLGWRVMIRDCPRELSFRELFLARIAGEAVDYVTPSAQLGGQFVMALMVRRKLKMAASLATVIVAAFAEGSGQIIFITLALLISLPLEARMHDLLWPVLGGMAFALALLAGFFFIQTRNPFSYLWRAAKKLEIPQFANPEVKAAAAEADEMLLKLYQNERPRLAASVFCYIVAWAMGPVEIYILLRLLHVAAGFQIALLVEGLGLLIERAFFLIPAKLVSQEGGKALILAMLGYSPDVGFAIGFLRRIKEMIWVLFGLASLTAHRLLVERAGAVARPARGQTALEVQGAQGGRT